MLWLCALHSAGKQQPSACLLSSVQLHSGECGDCHTHFQLAAPNAAGRRSQQQQTERPAACVPPDSRLHPGTLTCCRLRTGCAACSVRTASGKGQQAAEHRALDSSHCNLREWLQLGAERPGCILFPRLRCLLCTPATPYAVFPQRTASCCLGMLQLRLNSQHSVGPSISNVPEAPEAALAMAYAKRSTSCHPWYVLYIQGLIRP